VPNIIVKCYATLTMYCPPEGVLALPEPTDVAALVSMLDIPPEEVKLIFVNGKRADMDQVLAEGDRVGLFPPVGGG
jgi:molybdopterin converting factor small subunit